MSKIKQSLANELDITDITDSRDTGEYIKDDPTLEDLFMNSLLNTVRALDGLTLTEFLPELTECRNRIEKLILEAERPF